jgi:hypothetical protein
MLAATVRQQASLLPERDNAARPAFHRFLKCSQRQAIVGGQGDQLLDTAIVIIPLFDAVRQIKGASIAIRDRRTEQELGQGF